ncbi:MAG: hypothetical protein KF732_10275 [Flavobacteriales bacterium]|nr:hypothetical protein [Flavobacteriales bacterium]
MLAIRNIFAFVFLLNIGFNNTFYAQKQRVIVVPYDRFQFVSQYPLDEIATANQVQQSEVFTVYQQNLIESFLSFNNQEIEFVGLTPIEQLALRKKTKYQLEKFKGKKYNATNLNLLSEQDFKNLLEQHQANYILFVNWYAIEKSVHIAYVGDNNKRYPFSLHLLDFDVYNKEKVKILGKGNVKLYCGEFPSNQLIEEKSLKASSLKSCYKQLVSDLTLLFKN